MLSDAERSGGGENSTVVLGVRRAESAKRSKRAIYYYYNGKYSLNPIVDWKDNDVWDFIRKYKLPYPDLYNHGHNRLGCVMCPLACRKSRIRDYNEYPERVRALEKAVDKFIETHPQSTIFTLGKNGREIVYKWCYESPIESAKGACMQPIFEEDERG